MDLDSLDRHGLALRHDIASTDGSTVSEAWTVLAPSADPTRFVTAATTEAVILRPSNYPATTARGDLVPVRVAALAAALGERDFGADRDGHHRNDGRCCYGPVGRPKAPPLR